MNSSHWHACVRAVAVILDCEHRHRSQKAAQKCREARDLAFVRECVCLKRKKGK